MSKTTVRNLSGEPTPLSYKDAHDQPHSTMIFKGSVTLPEGSVVDEKTLPRGLHLETEEDDSGITSVEPELELAPVASEETHEAAPAPEVDHDATAPQPDAAPVVEHVEAVVVPDQEHDDTAPADKE